ncbi:hypothetical protein SShM2_126 [Synechococcus phage S-ShM2]|uniref:Uncharacterized protein n=2 Tax=Ahtivirus sagseatwo TaxID=2734079 RepID=E3SK27_9CAUD|nr:hypothetical protein SShM2_126 [Synechococcus phage S-ShM2]ADO97737.1 hypothetical protein SShM2_126 [Synechococcus phage S-ShM2]
MSKVLSDSQWRHEYLDIMGSQLSDYKKQLLETGPNSLAQAWTIQAMKRDYTLKKWNKS